MGSSVTFFAGSTPAIIPCGAFAILGSTARRPLGRSSRSSLELKSSSKEVLADCAPLCLLLFLSLLLAGGCILAPPLDLWPDLEHPFHKDSGG